MKQKRILPLTGTIILLFACCFVAFSSLAVGAEDAGIYKDKNGYFEFVPPKDWTRKDFSNDPRSKVHFQSPDGAATIGIIVRPDEGETYEELLVRQKENTENHKLRFPNGQFILSETTMCGLKTVKIEINIPDAVKQELYFFLTGGLHFNLTYGAANTSDLAKYKSEAINALSSIKPRSDVAKTTE